MTHISGEWIQEGTFATRQDVLFVVVTAPPLVSGETDATADGLAKV